MERAICDNPDVIVERHTNAENRFMFRLSGTWGVAGTILDPKVVCSKLKR
jgi:hypothetical protein